MKRLYIIDTSEPFTGSVYNTMSCQDEFEPVYVDYQKDPTTFEEYKNKVNLPLKLVTWEELEPMIRDYKDSICGNWMEISEEQWWDNLECLPPLKWRTIARDVETFAVGECYTFDLYTFCVRIKDQYYSALMPIHSTDIRILNSLTFKNIKYE